MDKLIVFALFFPILMGITFFQYRKELLFLAKNKLINEAASFDLVIVVPSSRQNEAQREAIRNSWWASVKANGTLAHRVMLKFVVGAFGCPYPPEVRLNEHGCEEWTPGPVAEEGIISSITPAPTSYRPAHTRNYGLQYLPFQVDHPVLLSRLGIHENSIVQGSVVRLVDAITEKTIVSATFDSESPGDYHGGFYYKSVETYLLPKGFEGIIAGENTRTNDGKLPARPGTVHHRLSNSSALHFVEFLEPVSGHYEDPFAWEANSIPIVAFRYNIQNPKDLQNIADSRQERLQQTRRENVAIDDALQRELERYDDILFVDVVDTYRNIPQKLLKTYQWLAALPDFRYVLKTDDDSYVDVARIMGSLEEKQAFREHIANLWWGRFRHNWPVEHYGKWAERSYPGPVYPRFACGAGYLLSNHLVRWISDNSNYLSIYQGEDTSLGIWLAALLPRYVDDPLWQCNKGCISDMYAMPDLSPTKLQQMWTDKIECDDPCGCR